jgi:hypothetical protein
MFLKLKTSRPDPKHKNQCTFSLYLHNYIEFAAELDFILSEQQRSEPHGYDLGQDLCGIVASPLTENS